MARRGRFGRSETGASNLSAMIRQLVSEQQAAEEKALMDAFYNGLEYNGSIPTIDDVKAFYSKWLDITGLEPSDADYQIINQKIEVANNFDISRTYQILQDEFTATLGANFQEVVDFINGRAKESTDPEDSRVYESALSAFSSNYVTYRSKDLIDGRIGAPEYRSMIDSVLANLDPADPLRDSILADSFSSQWTAMSRKKLNLLAIGKISESGYASWARGFAKDMLAAGFNKKNTTYLDALASAANVSGRAGGGSNGAQNTNAAELSGMWSAIRSEFAGAEYSWVPGEPQSTNDMLKEIAAHPEWLQKYASLADQDPSMVPQEIRDITKREGGEAIISYFGDLLETGVNLSKNDGGFTAQRWLAAEQNAGTSTSWRVIKNVDDVWQKDRQNAAGDAQTITWLDNEYAKFLDGQDSYYGKLPDAPLAQNSKANLNGQQQILVANQLQALTGGFTEGQANVSTSSAMTAREREEVAERLSSVVSARDISNKLQSGELVNGWSEKDQKWIAQKPTGVDLGNGFFSYVSVKKIGDEFQSQVRVVAAKQVESIGPDGTIKKTDYRYVYIPETGETQFIDKVGQIVDSSYFAPIGEDGYIFSGDAAISSSDKLAQRVYFDDSAAGYALSGSVDPSDPNSAVVNAEDARIAAAAAEAVASAGILVKSVRDVILGDEGNPFDGQIYEAFVKTADDLALAALQSKPVDPKDLKTRSQIADYSGDIGYANFLIEQSKNPTYKEVSPNVWHPIDTREIPAFGQLNQLNTYMGQQGTTPASLLSLIADPASLAATAFGVLDVLAGGITKPVIDKRSPEQKRKDEAAGLVAAAPQIEAMTRTGYPTTPGNQFFRNLGTTQTQTAPLGSSYMALQATAPKPSTPKPIVPKPAGVMITGAPGYGSIRTPATTTKTPINYGPGIIDSGPRQGQPMGGGL